MEQCNGCGIQVLSLLSAGGVSDVDRLAVHDDQTLIRLESKWRGNLDGFYDCGIIVSEHMFYFFLETVQ